VTSNGDTRPRPRKSKKRRLGKAKAAQGRRLYVIGECRSYQEVADTLGVSLSAVGATAAAEEWTRLRTEYAQDTERRALQTAQRAEVQAVVRSRRLIWAAAQLSIKSLAKRLERGELTPRPSEVESIVRTALALRGAAVEDALDDDELERVSLLEIAQRCSKQIEQGLGGQ